MNGEASSSARWLLYGATGYTGQLITRMAVRTGLRPIVAGRNPDRVRALASEWGLAWRAAPLDAPSAVDGLLEGVDLVLHCAGPFIHTATPMIDACLRTRTHYLDITGEIIVFEMVADRNEAARGAGIMLLPGAGFDVVPSDCLAAHLRRRLPTATSLVLAFQGRGTRPSHGTALSALEHAPRGGWIRRGGVLTHVPHGWRTRRFDFGAGPVPAVTIPWGDVSTAYHTTGIPDIEVYAALPAGLRRLVRAGRYLAGALRLAPLRNFARWYVRRQPSGPSEAERARGMSFLWGEVTDGSGRRAVSRQRGPEGYTLTALTALALVRRVLAGQAPAGFQTPARAYGADFILEIDGVEREDLS